MLSVADCAACRAGVALAMIRSTPEETKDVYKRQAAGGHWEKGPDLDFINAMHENLGEGGIIAEDLGYLTPDCLLYTSRCV